MPRTVFAAVFLPICALAAQPQPEVRAYAASELTEIALQRNREYLALRQKVLEARGLLRQAGVRPAPSLDVSGSTGSFLGSPGEEEYTAGIAQPVELGGKRDKRLRVAEVAVRLAEAEAAGFAVRLSSDIRLRAADAESERARAAALLRMRASYLESIQLLDARVAQGDAAPLDRQLLQVELGRTEALARSAEGRLQVAYSDLRRLCGFGPDEDLRLDVASRGAPAVPPLELLQKRALERRPDLAAARFEEERNGAAVTLAEAQGRGDLTLSAQYGLRNERMGGLYGYTAAGQLTQLQDRDNIVSFGVSVPLFTQRRNQGNVEAAAARAAGSRTLRQHLEATIPLQVQAARQHWEAATQSLSILDAGVVRQAEKNVEVIRQAYELGQLRLLDVLNEQRRLIELQMALIEAEADVRRGVVELERAVGGDLK